jgi:hypothetical protein
MAVLLLFDVLLIRASSRSSKVSFTMLVWNGSKPFPANLTFTGLAKRNAICAYCHIWNRLGGLWNNLLFHSASAATHRPLYRYFLNFSFATGIT